MHLVAIQTLIFIRPPSCPKDEMHEFVTYFCTDYLERKIKNEFLIQANQDIS